jgi:hypothetical protein
MPECSGSGRHSGRAMAGVLLALYGAVLGTVLALIAPAVAGTPIYLSADPPKAKIDPGPSLSLGRVGPDLCPGGFCRTEPNSNLYNFITPKGPRPIEPVRGILLSIPLGNAAR